MSSRHARLQRQRRTLPRTPTRPSSSLRPHTSSSHRHPRPPAPRPRPATARTTRTTRTTRTSSVWSSSPRGRGGGARAPARGTRPASHSLSHSLNISTPSSRAHIAARIEHRVASSTPRHHRPPPPRPRPPPPHTHTHTHPTSPTTTPASSPLHQARLDILASLPSSLRPPSPPSPRSPASPLRSAPTSPDSSSATETDVLEVVSALPTDLQRLTRRLVRAHRAGAHRVHEWEAEYARLLQLGDDDDGGDEDDDPLGTLDLAVLLQRVCAGSDGLAAHERDFVSRVVRHFLYFIVDGSLAASDGQRASQLRHLHEHAPPDCTTAPFVADIDAFDPSATGAVPYHTIHAMLLREVARAKREALHASGRDERWSKFVDRLRSRSQTQSMAMVFRAWRQYVLVRKKSDSLQGIMERLRMRAHAAEEVAMQRAYFLYWRAQVRRGKAERQRQAEIAALDAALATAEQEMDQEEERRQALLRQMKVLSSSVQHHQAAIKARSLVGVAPAAAEGLVLLLLERFRVQMKSIVALEGATFGLFQSSPMYAAMAERQEPPHAQQVDRVIETQYASLFHRDDTPDDTTAASASHDVLLSAWNRADRVGHFSAQRLDEIAEDLFRREQVQEERALGELEAMDAEELLVNWANHHVWVLGQPDREAQLPVPLPAAESETMSVPQPTTPRQRSRSTIATSPVASQRTRRLSVPAPQGLDLTGQHHTVRNLCRDLNDSSVYLTMLKRIQPSLKLQRASQLVSLEERAAFVLDAAGQVDKRCKTCVSAPALASGEPHQHLIFMSQLFLAKHGLKVEPLPLHERADGDDTPAWMATLLAALDRTLAGFHSLVHCESTRQQSDMLALFWARVHFFSVAMSALKHRAFRRKAAMVRLHDKVKAYSWKLLQAREESHAGRPVELRFVPEDHRGHVETSSASMRWLARTLLPRAQARAQLARMQLVVNQYRDDLVQVFEHYASQSDVLLEQLGEPAPRAADYRSRRVLVGELLRLLIDTGCLPAFVTQWAPAAWHVTTEAAPVPRVARNPASHHRAEALFRAFMEAAVLATLSVPEQEALPIGSVERAKQGLTYARLGERHRAQLGERFSLDWLGFTEWLVRVGWVLYADELELFVARFRYFVVHDVLAHAHRSALDMLFRDSDSAPVRQVVARHHDVLYRLFVRHSLVPAAASSRLPAFARRRVLPLDGALAVSARVLSARERVQESDVVSLFRVVVQRLQRPDQQQAQTQRVGGLSFEGFRVLLVWLACVKLPDPFRAVEAKLDEVVRVHLVEPE